MLAYLDTIIAFSVVMLGLSLMITLLNQMISAFLGYRGSNLRWGIETMLTTLDPNLGAQARNIANQILTNPIVSDSIFAKFNVKLPLIGKLLQRWKLASAIGPDALVRTLTQLNHPDINPLLAQLDPETVRKLRMIYGAFNSPPADPPAGGAAVASPPAAPNDPKYAVQVDDVLKQLGSSVQQSVGRVEAWFNIAMNRVSQRFTMQIRIWTVVFAFLLAFGLHVDSINLFDQFLRNPALRESFVNKSGAMMAQYDEILGTSTGGQAGSTDPTTAPKVLGDKMKYLIDTDVKKDTEATPALLGAIPSSKTLADSEKWLRDNLKPEVPGPRKDELAAKFRGYVIAGLKDKISDLSKMVGIENLIPAGQTWGKLRHHPWKFFFEFNGGRNGLGVLLTAALLALGAPFWYNALKNLTNLRPMVAQRQDEQKKDAA